MNALIYGVSGLLWVWALVLYGRPVPAGVSDILYRAGLATLVWFLPLQVVLYVILRA
jgi:hypothetical protein